MDIQSGTKTVQSLIRSWKDGDIQLPPFQRGYVWQIRKTLNLLDSLYRRYPIGAIYLWRPSEKSKLRPKRRKDGRNRLDFTHYVIDGQQRLTSLAAAFGLSEMYDESNQRSLECSLELTTDDAEGDGVRLTRLFHSPANKNERAGRDLNDAPTRVPLRDLAGGEPIERLRERKRGNLKKPAILTSRSRRPRSASTVQLIYLSAQFPFSPSKMRLMMRWWPCSSASTAARGYDAVIFRRRT